jgi:5-methylcytosine-specific restriction endonuclease McrA
MPKNRLYSIHERILDVMRAHPEGISEGDIRKILSIPPEEQAQFGRRRRDLHKFFHIDKKQDGPKTLYILRGPKEQPLDADPITPSLRIAALHSAQTRCQMCGKTIQRHGITLVIDHRLPRDWGGKTVTENLWAICEQCNHDKQNLFNSMDSPAVKHAMRHKSVHLRIGELLKAVGLGEPVSSQVIEFIAMDQDDWKKRLRELRYLNWIIDSSRKKMPDGRVRSSYTLKRYTDWPPEPTKWIRKYEQARRDGDQHVLKQMKREAAALTIFE